MKSYFFLPLAALAILGAGCLGQPGTPAQPSPAAPTAEEPSATEPAASETKTPVFTIDPCALVTADDAKQLLGGPVNPAETSQSEEPAGKLCRYSTTRESDLSRLIELTVYESANLQASSFELPADEYFKRLKSAHFTAAPDETEQISGYGDDAYWFTNSARVLKGQYVMHLTVRGFTDVKNQEATLKLLDIILARLK